MSEMLTSLLKKALAENHLDLTTDQQQKLIAYLELMQKWNKVYNLTTILNPHDMVYLHLIDSLVISPYLNGSRFLDVGTGAGLPGIPLAIIHPEKHWVLLDKNSKKTRFLTQATALLKLMNVEVIHSRAEDFHPQAGFDSILSRALGTISLFVEETAHLLNQQGVFLAMKGKLPEEELAALPPTFKVVESVRLEIKGIAVERNLVILRK